MFWLGDSAWGWRRWLYRSPYEFMQGITDNIPVCCAFYYCFIAKTLALFTSSTYRTIRRDKFSWGQTADLIVFSVLYSLDATFNKNKRELFPNSFKELQYWRCPICTLVNKKKKLNWKSGLNWEYGFVRKKVLPDAKKT